jgi:photosynthetic reaction center H subunit
MQYSAITGYVDAAQVLLYVFWVFFAGLIYYLRQEDKREGYPLVPDGLGRVRSQGFPPVPSPKTFILAHGGTVQAPRDEAPCVPTNSVPSARFIGAPLDPTGDPLLSGIGPASYANRLDEPDLTFEGGIKIVPMRVDHELWINRTDPDPRGANVIGADRKVGGKVIDIWVDKSEMVIRYLEVETASGAHVLLPMPLARVKMVPTQVLVDSILSTQFEAVPKLAKPDQVTFLEEDKISAYYGGGTLWATPSRAEPFL